MKFLAVKTPAGLKPVDPADMLREFGRPEG